MSQVRFIGGPGPVFPNWPKYLPLNAAPALSPVSSLDSAGDQVHVTGIVKWKDGATHALRTIAFRTGSSTASATLRVSPQALSTAAGPPARGDGTVTGSEFATQVNPAANTNYALTLGADRAGVAHGSTLVIVFDWAPAAYTSGGTQIQAVGNLSSNYTGHRPQCVFYNEATYATANVIPCVSLVADDGTEGIFAGALPQTSAITATAFNSGSTAVGDEIGLYATITAPCRVGYMNMNVTVAADATFDFVLYRGTSALYTLTVDEHTIKSDAGIGFVEAVFPDQDFAVGDIIRAVIKPTTANNVTVYYPTFGSAGRLETFAGITMGMCARTDAGAFTDTATMLPWGQLGLSAIGADTGGSVTLPAVQTSGGNIS